MVEIKKKKVAWGITGGGEGMAKTLAVMEEMKKKYEKNVDIRVFLSKAGEHVARIYGVLDGLKHSFEKTSVELSSNVPFLAGQMQTGKFEFLLVAPATANTVAKVAGGIADTMVCNAVAMGLKCGVSVYLMPTDFKVGEIVTLLPGGKKLKLKVRKEDVAHVEKLREMEGLSVIEQPEKIKMVFEKHFTVKK